MEFPVKGVKRTSTPGTALPEVVVILPVTTPLGYKKPTALLVEPCP